MRKIFSCLKKLVSIYAGDLAMYSPQAQNACSEGNGILGFYIIAYRRLNFVNIAA